MKLSCLYCPTILTPSTAPAHVIPNALGGRLAPRTTECDACNHGLNEEIEGEFNKLFHPTAALLGIVKGDGSPVAPLVVDLPDEPRMLLRGGVFTPVGPGPERVRPDGKKERIHYGTPERRAEGLAHDLRRKRITLEQLEREEGVHIEASPHAARQIPIPEFRRVIDEDKFRRVMAKMAVGFLGACEPALARRCELAEARRWIRTGTPMRRELDFGIAPTTVSETFHHLIEVAVVRGALFARVVLFGHLDTCFNLAAAWRGGPLTGRYEVDPIRGKTVRRASCARLHVSGLPEWLRAAQPLSPETFAASLPTLDAAGEAHLARARATRVMPTPPADTGEGERLNALIRENLVAMDAKRKKRS